MCRFRWMGFVLLFAGAYPVAEGFQESVPPIPSRDYEAEIPEDTNPLQGDAVAESRIQDDASRLAGLVGDDGGDSLSASLSTLLDSTIDDAERLAAAAELRKQVSGFDPDDDVLRSVGRQVERRVRLVEAGLAGLQEAPADSNARQLLNELVIRTAVDFEGSGREAYAAESRRLYKLLKQTHPAVYSRIQPVMIDEYFNYNLHFVVSEPMLSMLASDFRTETGDVADCILGAWVTGCQTTDTMITVDIKPSENDAVFDINADGRTTSDTQGRKKPATVYTRGDHSFQITKRVHFDGRSLFTEKANMAVNPNNRTVGVRTDFDRIPIIRGIARNIAYGKAQELRGQSEAIAAKKLAGEALPRFEAEVGDKFQDANNNLQDNFLRDLEKRGIAPESYSTRSSETHLAMSTRTIAPTTLSSAPPPDAPAPKRGIAIQAHESVINAGLTSLNLGGPTSPLQLIETIEQALEDLTDREVDLRRPEEKDKNTDFDFEAEDPIRVRFDENQIVLLFRTGFYQYEKGEERPEEPTLDKQVFEIPIDVTFENGEIILTPPPLDNLKEFGAKIKQRPADGSKSKGVGALRRTIQARKIAQQLVTAVFNDPENPGATDKRIPAEVKVLMGDGSRLKLRVTRFQVSDGWITAVLNK